MEQRRFVLFIALSIVIVFANMWIQTLLRGKQPPQPPVAQQKQDGQRDKKKAPDKPADQPVADKPAVDAAVPGVAAAENEPAEAAPQWFTLGSADPSDANSYRLLATLTSEGAAVLRIELASPRFRDLEDRSGYLGHLVTEDVPRQGAQVRVVGAGTPAAIAGLQSGDILTAIDGQPVIDNKDLTKALANTRPGQKTDLTFLRNGQPQTASAVLGRRPLEVVRPEVLREGTQIPQLVSGVGPGGHDPLSFLLTLFEVDGKKLSDDAAIDAELGGVKLRSAHWEGKQVDNDTVEFTRALPKWNLEVVKRYRIAKVDDEKPLVPAYHLTLDVELRNTGQEERKVAYQLDGPTGLPMEGWWYSTRIARSSGGAGVRDAAMLLHGKEPALFSAIDIAGGKLGPPWQEDSSALLTYAGDDAQYFASALLPNPSTGREKWLAQIKPILAGRMPDEAPFKPLGNVSCRLVSLTRTLKADEPLKHTYTVFAGPKQPELLAQYPLQTDPVNNLGELVYYGWPIWAAVARPMTHILRFFYSIVGNYGIAIIMLTVLVRGCMFPLSRKQALGAQKMQELKPEMDRISEKYKGKPEEKTKAMQELWRKHNYNPMSGCLLALLQLPIFIGLYRSLMINVELRQAPLLGEGIRWCSNLAAPDMAFRWADWAFMPSFLTAYKGFLSLGPYLNLLPIFTVGLFIVQQQMFMPPATDDQTRMQQKMMKYMMVLIGYMFYTVPSGLCLYIIASSLWGIAEKQLLPKSKLAGAGVAASAPTRSASAGGNGAAARRDRKKQRGGK